LVCSVCAFSGPTVADCRRGEAVWTEPLFMYKSVHFHRKEHFVTVHGIEILAYSVMVQFP